VLIANYCDRYKHEYYEQWGTDESDEEQDSRPTPQNSRHHTHKAFR
jgi:hypothetical protein